VSSSSIAIYAQNRCYKPSPGMTPYEAFLGERLDVSKLVIFGSLAFVYIPKEKDAWNKLLSKAFPGIIVGYAGSGYRICNPVRKELVVSNHVEVKEARQGAELLDPEALPRLRDEADEQHRSTLDNDINDTSILRGDTIIVEVPGTDITRNLQAEQDDLSVPSAGNLSPRSRSNSVLIESPGSDSVPEILQSEGSSMPPPAKTFRDKPVPVPSRSSSRIRGISATPVPFGDSEPSQHSANMATVTPNLDSAPRRLRRRCQDLTQINGVLRLDQRCVVSYETTLGTLSNVQEERRLSPLGGSSKSRKMADTKHVW
jgi:hypothetical protein